jgi:hypothetical protein
MKCHIQTLWEGWWRGVMIMIALPLPEMFLRLASKPAFSHFYDKFIL